MSSENVSHLVYGIERIESASTDDANIRKQICMFLEYHRRNVDKYSLYSGDEWRGLLLCVNDLISPTHPKSDLMKSALIAAMFQCAEQEPTG